MSMLRWLLLVLACVVMLVAVLIGFEVYDGEHLFGWLALGFLLYLLSLLGPPPRRAPSPQR